MAGADDNKSWLKRLFERPAWRRAAAVAEEACTDAYTTIVLMLLIFLIHKAAHWLGFDRSPIGGGFHMADIFTLLHVLNIVINGCYAIFRLIRTHRSLMSESRSPADRASDRVRLEAALDAALSAARAARGLSGILLALLVAVMLMKVRIALEQFVATAVHIAIRVHRKMLDRLVFRARLVFASAACVAALTGLYSLVMRLGTS